MEGMAPVGRSSPRGCLWGGVGCALVCLRVGVRSHGGSVFVSGLLPAPLGASVPVLLCLCARVCVSGCFLCLCFFAWLCLPFRVCVCVCFSLCFGGGMHLVLSWDWQTGRWLVCEERSHVA